MKKIGIVAAIAAVAVVLGVAGFGRTSTVKADPTDILALNPTIVASLTDADAGPDCAGTVDYNGDGVDDCDLTIPGDLAEVADADGDNDGVVEPEDFEGLDLDADQLIEGPASALWVLVFVDDQEKVTIDPDSGVTLVEDTTPADGQVECGLGLELVDNDCDGTAPAGDGVVVVTAQAAAAADAGDTEAVEADQDTEYLDMDLYIVGEPDEITLTALEGTIQGGFDLDDCDELDLSDAEDEAAAADVGLLLAVVEDNDGTALAGIMVGWDSDDEDVVGLNSAVTLTLDLDAGIMAVNLACGGDTGTADVEASNISTLGDPEDDTATITVIGGPADIALTATPAEIVCDGVTSSDVTATVTDADGNPVVDGTEVHFDVVALGTAYPIVVETVDGMATSTITPLSDIGAGVTVIVWAGDHDAEASIRVDCAEPAPPPPPPPVTPEPGIVPPPTGTGGYLGADAGGLSWLALAGLAIGGLTLSLGGIALRRYAR